MTAKHPRYDRWDRLEKGWYSLYSDLVKEWGSKRKFLHPMDPPTILRRVQAIESILRDILQQIGLPEVAESRERRLQFSREHNTAMELIEKVENIRDRIIDKSNPNVGLIISELHQCAEPLRALFHDLETE